MSDRSSHGPYGELIYSYEFCGFEEGEVVRVNPDFVSDRVQWMGSYKFEIMRFVTNIENGRQWVDLYGGAAKWAHKIGCDVRALVKVDARR